MGRTGWKGRQVRFGLRTDVQIQSPGFQSLENAWPEPLLNGLGFDCHARVSSRRKLSALSRLIWGIPSSVARVIRGGWNTGNSVKRSPQKPGGGGLTGTIPGKNRIRFSPPSGSPTTTSNLRPSMISVSSSVQRIEAREVAAV